ncbi:MAG: hypothetical protein ACI84K_001288 [Pseudohongiellaceae bacterium]|jgi:hypothetical protein
MMSFKRRFMFAAAFSLVSILLSTSLYAEERKKSKAEEMATAGSKKPIAELGRIGASRTGKVTEEQAVEQLKYMMVQGWTRIDKDLKEEGSFIPMGLTLSPQGEFKAVHVESQTGELRIKPEFALKAVVLNIKEIAKTRAVWAVGIMYIQAKEKKDGTHEQRIQVMTEHIAGWARHWSYPFKVIEGVVKLGAPIERPVAPTYFISGK